MKFITVNPTWNVPPSIIANEYLPALRSDPDALKRIGLKIEQNPDGTVRIYQPPGEANALGRIRFNFPNKFLVYQHDTPDKNLFAHDKRAYSHGCMRVQDPLMYGEKLLSIVLPNENYTAERLRKMFGGSEINIDFPVHIPVHLTYQSALRGRCRQARDPRGRLRPRRQADFDHEGRRAPRGRYRRRLARRPARASAAMRCVTTCRARATSPTRSRAGSAARGPSRRRARPSRWRSRSGRATGAAAITAFRCATSRALSTGFSASFPRIY